MGPRKEGPGLEDKRFLPLGVARRSSWRRKWCGWAERRGRFFVLGSCWASRRHCPGPSPVQRGPPSCAGVEGASGVPSAIWVVVVSRPLLSGALSPPLGKQAAEAGSLSSLPGGGSECWLLAAREPAPGRASASPSLVSCQQTSLRRGDLCLLWGTPGRAG